MDTKSISENSTIERATSSVQIEPKEASFENGYKIGQRIPAGEFALTVLGIETSRSSYTDTYAVKAGNVMLAVQVKIETNQWNPFHTIAKQRVLLIGRNGSYQLSAHGGKTPSFNTPFGATGGKSAIGWLTFEVPEDESDFILSYKSWDSEDLRVSLGGSQ